jgi:predicted Fe-Mo cluster-binding NifX family protein
LADTNGSVSQHFGTAPFFALRDVHVKDGNVIEQRIVSNPHAGDPRGRGLKVAQWLLAQRVDVIVTADDIREKGPGYALSDAGVEITIAAPETLGEASVYTER